MDATEQIWMNGDFLRADRGADARAHTLHYGAGAFEGIRYRTIRSGDIRLDDHLIARSAASIRCPSDRQGRCVRPLDLAW